MPSYNSFAPPIFPNIQAPQGGPTSPHMTVATDALNLTPQEQQLYQMHLSNLYGSGGVDHLNGSRSSLYQSVEPHNGRYYNIPTVWDGRLETQKYTMPNDPSRVIDIANPQALQNVSDMGWQNFPSYPTKQQADARYQQMHGYMERDTMEKEKATAPQWGPSAQLLGGNSNDLNLLVKALTQ